MKNKKKRTTDDKNWEILFNTQFDNLQGKISKYWINGFSRLGLDNTRVPTVEYLNEVSKKYTGWKFIQTDDEFTDRILWNKQAARGEMSVSNFVRTPEELYYCSQPDKWHDIIGHVPLFMTEAYSRMYRSIAKLLVEALKKGGDARRLEVGNINWFITEVALIREKGTLRAFGATLYSSSGELEKAFAKEPEPLTLDGILALDPYDRSKLQDTYFVVESLEQVMDLLEEYRQRFLRST